MKWPVALPHIILAIGILFGASTPVMAGGGVHYDKNGRPYVMATRGGKRIRLYCPKAFYGVYQCPKRGKRLRFGPYDRDFAFSQGHQIKR